MADEDAKPPRRGLGGEKKPTINDVARLAGVSKKTVSRVINQSPFVKDGTREKINKIIAEIGFSPDLRARPRLRRSFLIGLVYDNPNPQYVVNMQLGMLDAMRGSGYELVVHPCNRGNPTFLADFRRFIERQKLSGVVLTPSVSEDDRVKAILDEVGCAYIRIASVPVDEPEHIIVSNDRLGGRAAARHLAELGHTRMGFISGPPTFRSSHERRGGFEEELKERKLDLTPDYIMQGAYTFETGISCGAELLKRDPRPTAIFAANDEMAAGVLHAIRRAGLRCPDDVSVIGFDDFQIASSVWPPLTTVRTPTREIGRMAAEKLIGLATEEETAPEAAPATSPALVVRDSTGPAPR
ncbi:MAG: LacI family DNA-binding transcriptional regulator [Hyphomonadaceae bacterium]